MAKKELAIRLLVEEKEVNKALAMLGQEVLTTDELDKKFFNGRTPFVLDVEELEDESEPMVLAFVALIEDNNQKI